MLQNILEQEDFIKGLPDASLYGEMEQPSGQLPQFLVLSEIQRRTDMRERYEATQEQPEGTVSEQIIAGGLRGMMPDPMTMASQTMGSPIPTDPTSQVPAVAAGAPPPPTGGTAIGNSGLAGMGGQPQGMASGGIIGYQEGRQVEDESYLFDKATGIRDRDPNAAVGHLVDYDPMGPIDPSSERGLQLIEDLDRKRRQYGDRTFREALNDLIDWRSAPGTTTLESTIEFLSDIGSRKEFMEENPHLIETINSLEEHRENILRMREQAETEEAASGGVIGMQKGGAFGPEYHALQEQRRELAPYMNPFSGSYSPAVSSAAQTMVGQSQEAYRGALGKEARIRKEEERLREIEAIERFGGVVPEELKETYLLEGDIESEYGAGTPLPEELLRPLEDVGNIAEIVADMTGEEIGTEYTGTATRPIGGGDADLVGTDTAADADSFQLQDVLNEFETAQELGGEELTSAYADISGAIGQDAADQRKLPGTLDRSGVTDALTALVEGGAERLEARRGSTQELINQIREEGRRDAFSAAMMQLGAGVAGGDMSGGLQRAGEAATSINALARDAARAEGRSFRDYEEAALAQADEFGLKSATFEYEEGRDEAIRGEEIRQWEETYGLQAHVAETDRLLKEAAHDLSAAELRSLNVNRARTLEAAAEKIEFDLTKEEGVDLRAATTSFENYMETIQEAAEDMGAAFLPEAKLEFIRENQLMILKALRPRLSDEFYNAFINALEGEGGGPPSATASLSDEKYRM